MEVLSVKTLPSTRRTLNVVLPIWQSCSTMATRQYVMTDRVKRLETPEGRSRISSCREVLTTIEVANMLKLARITVYRMASRGDIPCYRNGKNLMFYRDEIMEWVNSGKTNGHLLPIMTADGYMPTRMA